MNFDLYDQVFITFLIFISDTKEQEYDDNQIHEDIDVLQFLLILHIYF